jgi:hypothetical protein
VAVGALALWGLGAGRFAAAPVNAPEPSGPELPPRCADAPAQWIDRVERGPRETLDADIVDVDADGHLDVVFANQYSESATIWWGRAGALPSERTDVPIGRIGRVPAFGDVNGDGLRDMLAGLQDGSALALLRGTGPRAWAAAERIFQEPAPYGVALVDLDGDGRDDALTTHKADTNVYLRWSRADVSDAFAPQRKVVPAPNGLLTRIFTSATDTFVWFPVVGTLVRARLLAEGRVGARHTWPLPGVFQSLLRDADHSDGVVVRVGSGERDILLRAGSADGPCALGDVAHGTFVHAVADLDGDGLVDLVGSRTCQFCDSNHIFSVGTP